MSLLNPISISTLFVFTLALLTPSLHASSPRYSPYSPLEDRTITPDNTCGGANAYTCDPNNQYGGPCCSSSGYCGKTSAYCNTGCQLPFSTSCNTSALNICGPSSGNYVCLPTSPNGGPCCSASGYCGSTAAYCGTGCQTAYGSCYGVSAPATKTGGVYVVGGVGAFVNTYNWTFTGSALPSGLVVNTDSITGGPKTATMVAANMNVTGGYLTLKVPGGQSKSPIQGGAVMTSFSNILYASVRTYAIFSSVSGTCVGQFYYHNETAEIDIEYLSNKSSTSNPNGQITLQYTNQPGDTSGSYNNTVLAPSTATSALHEYRVDWVKGKTMFYTDGVLMRTFTQYVPSVAGTWLWNNWANGDPSWSVGPPLTDNVFKIKNIVMYYNTTS